MGTSSTHVRPRLPDEGVHDAPRDPRRRRLIRLALAAAVAWALLSISALVVGEPTDVMRAAGGVTLIVAAVMAAHWRPFRLASVVAVGVYGLGLAAATLIGGAAGFGGGDSERVQLFTGNPNILGAALVATVAAWAALAPRRRWVWWTWPLAALAVLNTGSRTSGGALLAAGAIWLVAQTLGKERRWLLAPVVLLAVLAVAAFAWQRGVVELTPNLLAAPSDFTDPAWPSLAASLEVVEDASPGPFEGTMAQRLIGRAEPGRRHILHQSIGRSEMGVPYVASIYLRSDEPQEVRLTSHLARVTCTVDTTWRRCVTPVGYGDDYAQRQIHVQATTNGGAIDVYAFGAQYERGVEATPFLDLRPAWVPQSMVNRYDLRRITFLPENRLVAWEAGLDLVRERPWFGWGLGPSREAMASRTAPDPVTYAHHGLIQFAAVHGLVGLAGAALLVAALLATLDRSGWIRLAPLLVALALLNTWDVTFFDAPVFVPVLLAVAYWTARPTTVTEPPADRAVRTAATSR